MQSAMDTQALPVPTLAGTKHDRSTEGDAAEPVAKRRTVEDAMAEYKQAAAEHRHIMAMREPLERQRDELEAKLKTIPLPITPLHKYEAQIRHAYRDIHAVKLTISDCIRQICPWCRHTPKSRKTTGDLVCKKCPTTFHCCTTNMMCEMAKGPAQDCLGCRKPIV